MAMTSFTNYGDFTGDIFGETGVVATTNLVETNLITGVTATKSADKDTWINGPLKYTIVVNNTSGDAFANVVLTDTLNALVTLDTTYGVRINGTATTDYTFAGQLLTVQVGSVADADTATVEFQVLQV